MELQQYDFNIQHRPGKNNANADALSRLIPEQEKDDSYKEAFMFTINGESSFSECSEDNSKEEIEWHISLNNSPSTNNKIQNDEEWFEKELAQHYSNTPLITIGYSCGQKELEDIYNENLKIKQVIAGQPITKGGSQCTFYCDTENYHTHTYCKACKKNLSYGTIIHNCIIGFGPEKIQPDMNPTYLYNDL